MSSKGKIALGIGSFVFVAAFGGYMFSAKFTAAKFENGLKAENKKMMNVHSAGKNSLKTQSFALKNYTKSDLAKVEALIKKYDGKPGLLMMSIKENSQGLDPRLHKDFMDAVQKYYTKWEVVQTSFFSRVQEYENFIDASVKGSFAGMWGYPSKKAQDLMEQVIASNETRKTFATGVDEATDFFEDK